MKRKIFFTLLLSMQALAFQAQPTIQWQRLPLPSGIDEAVNPVNALSVFPNPSISSAEADFWLEKPAEISVQLMDIAGRVCFSGESQQFYPGRHYLKINTSPFPPGIYILQLRAGSFKTDTRLFIIHE